MDKHLRKIVAEEVAKTLREDYDYASAEREYFDKESHQQDEQMREALISSSLSFLQVLQGSANKLIEQKELSGTHPGVDKHLGDAIAHINQAIEIYFETLTPEIKSDVLGRVGEINIEK